MAEARSIKQETRALARSPLATLAGIGALQGLTLLVILVRGKLGAVLLGPAGVGILGVLEPLVDAVAQLSSFGLPIAAVKFLARAHSDGAALFACGYSRFLRRVLQGGVAGTASALLLLLAKPDIVGPVLRPYRGLLALALLGAPLVPLRDLVTNALAAARATGASAAMALWVALGSTAGACAGVATRGGVEGFLAGMLLGSAAVLLVTTLRLTRSWRGAARQEPAPGGATERLQGSEVTTTALVLWACFLSYPLTHFLARHVVLARFGAAEAGLLQAGLGVSGALAALLGPATALYLAPALNRRATREAKGRAALAFLRELALAVGLLTLPLALFPGRVLALLLAPAFAPVASSLFLLVAGQGLRVLAGVFHALLVGLDDVRVYGVLVGSGQLSFGLLSAWLGAQAGVKGVAEAFLLANLGLLLLTAGRATWRHAVKVPASVLGFVAASVLVPLALGSFCAGQPTPDTRGALARLGVGLALGSAFVAWSRQATPGRAQP